MTARQDEPRCARGADCRGSRHRRGGRAIGARYARPHRRRGDRGRRPAGGMHGHGPRSFGCSRSMWTRRRRRSRRGRRRASSGSSGAPSRWRRRRSGPRAPSRCADGIPVTGFSLADLLALAAGLAPGRLSRGCAKPGSAAIARAAARRRGGPGIGGARGSARRGLRGADESTSHAFCADAAAWQICERGARSAEGRRRLSGVCAAAARGCRLPQPTTGYDDVKLIALARVLVGEHPVDPGGLAAVRPEARAGRADVGADDVDGVAAVDPGDPRHAAEPARRDSRQHQRRGAEPVERDGLFAMQAAGLNGPAPRAIVQECRCLRLPRLARFDYLNATSAGADWSA